MAQQDLSLSLERRWWLWPAVVGVGLVAAAVDIVSPTMARRVVQLGASFLGQHGFKYVLGGKRV